MKGIYIWIFILVVCGLVATYYLIPSGEDIAHFQAKGRQYTEAKRYYEQEYKKGVRTPDLIIELSNLYEMEGQLDQASQLIEEYIKSYPEDIQAQKRLGDLYQLNLQYDKYYNTLLKLKKDLAKPDKDVLQQLVEIYKMRNQISEEREVLQELINEGMGNADDYFELAKLYAQDKQFAKAKALLVTSREFFPKEININSLLLEEWMDVEVNKQEGGTQEQLEKGTLPILAKYLNEKKDPKLVNYALGVFKQTFPQLLPSFIYLVKPVIHQDIGLEASVLQLYWDDPNQRDGVFKRLQGIPKEAFSNPQLQNLAFNVYLEKGEDNLLSNLIRTTPAKNLDERSIINLANYAREKKKTKLIEDLETALGPVYLQNHPVVDVAIAMSLNKPDSRQLLDDLIASRSLSQLEIYHLMNLAFTANYEKEVLELGARLPPFLGIGENELTDIAMMYVQLKKSEELYKMITASIPTYSEKNAAPALLILDIPRGETKKVADWVKSQKKVKESYLNALYLTAEISKEYPLALYLAKQLATHYPSKNANTYYAVALVHVGKIEKGLSLLKELHKAYPQDKGIERSYFDALVQASKYNARYQADLVAYMDEREKMGHLPIDLQRDFAYIYLDTLHEYKKGQRALENITQKAGPRDQDLQTLIYLWGPRVTEEQGCWITKRTRESSGEDFAYWLEYLIFIGYFDTVIDFYASRPQDFTTARAFFAYMDALAYEKLKCELREVIPVAFPYMRNRKELERLASYAEEAEFLEARTEIWEVIASNWSDDAKAWQNLARSIFDEHDYCGTDFALLQFFDLVDESNPRLYESLYEYGEVLYKWRSYNAANLFFNFSLTEMERAPEPTLRMLEIEALIYARFQWDELAIEVMRELFEKTGRDPDIAASYANFLMDAGCIRLTRVFLESLFGYQILIPPRCWCDPLEGELQ